MAQRDYVSRGRSSGARRKKTTSRRKKSASGTSKTMVALAVAVLVTFVGGLWFIAHNKPEETPVLPRQGAHTGNGLPPKPEERWRYIKELENRQPGITVPTEPSSGGEPQSQAQLTEEQRQLLAQMQSDMQRQPTQLAEVPYNDQSQVPRSQVTIKPPVNTAQTPVQNVPAAPPRTPPVAAQKPVQTAKTEPAKQPEKEKAQRWLVQCGSFKTMEPAESVRAQLAFAGVESRITSNGGWNRIMLGPYANRAAADKMLSRLKGIGASNCIPLASGG
ncbi:cell division protein FtsN [Affinibrenneria salicis]|uniref:Cell division protein FtsN n=1 Tax=Affinibrenneria salicis TaxID=2590031 RepID=A0A5J5FXR8_9GAMM|nr:cell division protein FtsN [Affinibrenneria salicis]KAA8998595.1 cell division protein FtsN [Affinibrenneria salicis]